MDFWRLDFLALYSATASLILPKLESLASSARISACSRSSSSGGGASCVGFWKVRPASKLNQLPSPGAFELSGRPHTDGGRRDGDIGLPLKIPSSGARSGGGAASFRLRGVMFGKAELTHRKLASGLGAPGAFSDRSPKADSSIGKFGAAAGAPCVEVGTEPSGAADLL